MLIEFIKMHGCGNDFVVIDSRDKSLDLPLADRAKLANRHYGVGCDQLIILDSPAMQNADVAVRIYNTDGSQAEACGNAMRCIARWLAEASGKNTIAIQVGERLLSCVADGREFWVDMGEAKLISESVDLVSESGGLEGLPVPLAVEIGNPHCIFIVDNAEAVNVAKWGSLIEMHSYFPNRTNVEFVSPVADNEFRLRVWERGAGITLACGSGAAAVAWALQHHGKIKNHVCLHMDGGDLFAKVSSDSHVQIKGETAFVYRGHIEL